MSPIQQVRHNTPLYIQDTLCWICAFISLHLHLPPWCCGIVISHLMRYRHKIHTRRSWKNPGPPKQNRIIYRKTLTPELCEFQAYACTLGRNPRGQQPLKSVAVQGLLPVKFIGIIFYVILPDFWTTFSTRCRGRFSNFLSKNGHGDTRNKMYRLPAQEFLAFLNNHLAVVLSQQTDMGLILWCAQDCRQPAVGIILGHISTFIELIKVFVCFMSQPPQLTIGHRSHRDLCTGMYPYIGIAHGIVLADIEHGVSAVVLINPFRAFQNRLAAAVRTAWCTALLSFILLHFVFLRK